MKRLKNRDVVGSTVCYSGSGKPSAAVSTGFAYMEVGKGREQGCGSFPSIRSYGYGFQSKPPLTTTADPPDSRILVQYAG